MAHPLKFSLPLCLSFVLSNCQLLPFAGYQQHLSFPAISGQLHTSTINDQQPIRQLSAGFHLNPLPPLPFLQSFPVNPQYFSSVRSAFKEENAPFGRFFGAPLKLNNLFTPNTIRQRPESEAQREEYRKYLKEEAEELEKERVENEITTDFGDFSIESTSLQPGQKTFVRVNIQGKDYGYST